LSGEPTADRFIPEHAGKNRIIVQEYINSLPKKMEDAARKRAAKYLQLPESEIVLRSCDGIVDWKDLKYEP
jgi:hypothetical protein